MKPSDRMTRWDPIPSRGPVPANPPGFSSPGIRSEGEVPAERESRAQDQEFLFGYPFIADPFP